ncbi:hypothetical protein SETIT_4G248400v2 [Setaria italica]|uniref:Uncharacterized protein n=1 Tax=Setaria italica TaxID=4555 RepID=A0A368QXW4_SETIT|nr:hypothetical protein SETIT_4G248400v2 [Setaria italica]
MFASQHPHWSSSHGQHELHQTGWLALAHMDHTHPALWQASSPRTARTRDPFANSTPVRSASTGRCRSGLLVRGEQFSCAFLAQVFFFFPILKWMWITSSGMVSDSFCGGRNARRIPLGGVSVARISWEISVGTSVIWTDSEELRWTCISNMVLGK